MTHPRPNTERTGLDPRPAPARTRVPLRVILLAIPLLLGTCCGPGFDPGDPGAAPGLAPASAPRGLAPGIADAIGIPSGIPIADADAGGADVGASADAGSAAIADGSDPINWADKRAEAPGTKKPAPDADAGEDAGP